MLGADQKERGLWGREWVSTTNNSIKMSGEYSLAQVGFTLLP